MSRPRAEFLKRRNEKIITLFDLDHQLRRAHTTLPWRTDPKHAEIIADTAATRGQLVIELKAMGVAPWAFNIDRDNSWVGLQRISPLKSVN